MDQWADSHCHFDFEDFNVDRDAVWRACHNNAMRYMLVPGIEPSQWTRLPQLHRTYAGLFFAVGLHPWWIAQQAEPVHHEPLTRALKAAAAQTGCRAIGECGLDKRIDLPMARQEAVLEWHLQVARELELPIVIHCVRAHNPLIRLLKRYPVKGGVIHAFNGSLQLAQTYCAMGFYLGVGGSITYERAHKTRAALAGIPLESLLLESDAPDMPLSGRQGKRNSPENIPLICEALAELRNESPARILTVTTRNFQNVFRVC